MTKPKPNKFYCWMKIIERPTGKSSDDVHMMIPSRPPGKKTASDKNSSDYEEEWNAIEPYYNVPTTSLYVLDYWSGKAFAKEKDATDWFHSSEGTKWLAEPKPVYYTLMAFDVTPK